jgi:hypothetical protein
VRVQNNSAESQRKEPFTLTGLFTHLRLTILNLELDGNLESLPVAGGLRDVVADLLGRQAQGTHLHKHTRKSASRKARVLNPNLYSIWIQEGKMINKNRKKLEILCFEVLDILF